MAVLVIGLVLLLLWYFTKFEISSEVISAFIGVLTGGIISGGFHYWVSQQQRKHQLRIAALERRLMAHQQAYTLWRRLLFANRDTNQIFDVIEECQSWWEQNCLFLSPEAREAFHRAYLSAGDHVAFLRSHEGAELIRDAFADIERAGSIIAQGVALPSIGDETAQWIRPKQ